MISHGTCYILPCKIVVDGLFRTHRREPFVQLAEVAVQHVLEIPDSFLVNLIPTCQLILHVFFMFHDYVS